MDAFVLTKDGVVAALKKAWQDGRVAIQNVGKVGTRPRYVYPGHPGIGCAIGVGLPQEHIEFFSMDDAKNENSVGYLTNYGNDTSIFSFTDETEGDYIRNIQGAHDGYMGRGDKDQVRAFVAAMKKMGIDLEVA